MTSTPSTSRGSAQAEREAARRERAAAARESHLAVLYGGPLEDLRLEAAEAHRAAASRHDQRAAELEALAAPNGALAVPVAIGEPGTAPPRPPGRLRPEERTERERNRARRDRQTAAQLRERADVEDGPLEGMRRRAADLHDLAAEVHERAAGQIERPAGH